MHTKEFLIGSHLCIGSISIDFFINLCFLLSFSFDWEDISNTQDSVWSHFQTPRSSWKISRHASYFQLSYHCLEMRWKTVFCVCQFTSNYSHKMYNFCYFVKWFQLWHALWTGITLQQQEWRLLKRTKWKVTCDRQVRSLNVRVTLVTSSRSCTQDSSLI